jgi:peptidoglycan/LPS O-acetylase OafA/YrhL
MTPIATATPHSRNQGIDLLRGVSIVLVIMHHLAIRMPLARTAVSAVLPARLLNALCWNGGEAVVVFFVISGFLITSHALDRWRSLGRPRIAGFYVRRAARILPCLLALVAILALLDLAGVPHYTITRADQSLPGAMFAALTFHLNWYEASSGYLPANWDVLWSLSVEEVFYLGFPLACLLARRSPTPLVVLLILLAASLPATRGAISGNELLREKAYLPGMAAIATGVLAALAIHGRTLPRRCSAALVAVGAAAWLGIMGAEDLIWPRLGESTMLILTGGTACALVGLHGMPRATLPCSAWLRAFGRLSYEAYLTHMFVVFTALTLFHQAGMPDRCEYLLYPAVLAAALWLAALVAHHVSQPAERRVRGWVVAA